MSIKKYHNNYENSDSKDYTNRHGIFNNNATGLKLVELLLNLNRNGKLFIILALNCEHIVKALLGIEGIGNTHSSFTGNMIL